MRRNRRAQRRQNRRRARTFQPDRRRRRRHIFQLHLVGDDVALDVQEHLLAQLRLRIEQEVIVETEEAEVGLNPPLRTQQEGVATASRASSS